MPYRYEEDAKCELWIKTLNQILEDDQNKLNSLQEFFGYCLTKDTKQLKALLLLGESRCLGGETLIYDPVKNKSIPVSEIESDFHVQAWDGNKIVTTKAEKPFTKEVDDLYTINLSNGQSFVASLNHQVLTPSGYFSIADVLTKFDGVLLQTILDNDLSTQTQDVRHCSNKVQDFQSGCLAYRGLSDEQLRKVLNNAQSSFPLQDDVQEHTYTEASLRKDDQANIATHNHLCQLNALHPTLDVQNPFGLALKNKTNYISSVFYELTSYLRRVFLRPKTETFHQKTILKSSSLDNCSCSILPYNSSSLVITSIVYKRTDVKYDFTVPIYHNYICAGSVHHNSGKSTLLHVLRYLVGEQNCSSVPLKDIKNSQHTPGLINKLLNIDYDVSQKAVEFEDEFKKITGGEPIRVNQKYVEAFSFNPYCKLAMSANIFPKITDHSSAFYNRLILIPCDRVFSPEEQNRDLPAQLLKELPGVLNWAIQGLERLNNRGRFEELEFMQNAVEELENENNPVNLFFEEHIQVVMGTYIEKAEVYEKYKKWSEAARTYTLSKALFASCLYKKYYKHTPKQCRLSEGKRAWIWKNLRYVDFKGQTEPQQVNFNE
jgi:P4 family phage/plasmid primase-like protien